MKTLKKIQLVIVGLAYVMVSLSVVNAQQIYTAEKGITKVLSSDAPNTHPPEDYTHPKGDIENNMGDFPPPYFSAGKDADVCNGDSHEMEGINSTSAVAIWETMGDGVFDDPYSLYSYYTPGELDKINGQVMLNLVLLVPGDTYPYKMSDSMILKLNDSCSEPYSSPQR